MYVVVLQLWAVGHKIPQVCVSDIFRQPPHTHRFEQIWQQLLFLRKAKRKNAPPVGVLVPRSCDSGEKFLRAKDLGLRCAHRFPTAFFVLRLCHIATATPLVNRC